MDLDENNPDSPETRVPLPNHSILDLLQFTPVCVVCTICKKPINGTVRAVKHHMSKHFIIPDGTQFRIGNQLQLGMDHAKHEDVRTLMYARRTTLWETTGTLVYIRFPIEPHLFPIGSFCFFHVCRGYSSP